MIQGVIDLCFLEDGQWVLADYKTDFASGEELVERYAMQVRWYAHALALTVLGFLETAAGTQLAEREVRKAM